MKNRKRGGTNGQVRDNQQQDCLMSHPRRSNIEQRPYSFGLLSSFIQKKSMKSSRTRCFGLLPNHSRSDLQLYRSQHHSEELHDLLRCQRPHCSFDFPNIIETATLPDVVKLSPRDAYTKLQNIEVHKVFLVMQRLRVFILFF